MVKPLLAAITGLIAAGATGCTSFEDPDVVIDLRILAMTSTPPDQIVTIDLTQPLDPAALLAQLVPTEVCVLVADPTLDRRLAWELRLCEVDNRCDDSAPEQVIGSGVVDDPETTVPAPRMCGTVDSGGVLPVLLLKAVQDDVLRGLGGVDYMVQLRIGGEDADRALDQYATKTLRISPRIPEERTANTNPELERFDTSIETDEVIAEPPAPVALPLGRCADTPAPLEIEPGARMRITPIEPESARELYVVPTLDGKSQQFTESLTYQWIASAGGFSSGSTGGPRDVSGNPAPLFTDFRAPPRAGLDGPMDISLWIIQRDERLGSHWYEACLRVVP